MSHFLTMAAGKYHFYQEFSASQLPSKDSAFNSQGTRGSSDSQIDLGRHCTGFVEQNKDYLPVINIPYLNDTLLRVHFMNNTKSRQAVCASYAP